MADMLMVIVLAALLIVIAMLAAIVFILRKRDPSSTQQLMRDLLTASEKSQGETLRLETKGVRDELQLSLSTTREEISKGLDRMRSSASETQLQFQRLVQERIEALQKSASEASQRQVTAISELKEKISDSVTRGLKEIQDKNEQKLEQMRVTVDEKLQKTLDQRITTSFELVTKSLLEVQKGLAEMQTLAQDVGGLKRALTNVKVRGMLGEAQLGQLLEQFLTRDQYEENVPVKPRSAERVEFAIRLPGPVEGERVWLPIDSKFPIEDYQRLQDAYEQGDKPAWEQAGKAFEARLYAHAATIASKYIDVPHSTDFALMFLPFESLYGEAIRRPGLFQDIQAKHKVTIVGPTTLAAFLNSLQVGFKTLAITRQSSEVWKVLGAVKTEFQKFGDAVSSVQRNLETASSNLGKVSTRARQMEKKLDKVAALPPEEASRLLPADSTSAVPDQEAE